MTEDRNNNAWRDWDGAIRIPAPIMTVLLGAALSASGLGLRWTWNLSETASRNQWRIEALERENMLLQTDHNTVITMGADVGMIKTSLEKLDKKMTELTDQINDRRDRDPRH